MEISLNSDFLRIDGNVPGGSEVERIEDFSQHLNASIDWTVAEEEQLAVLLETGELYLVAGGISSKNS